VRPGPDGRETLRLVTRTIIAALLVGSCTARAGPPRATGLALEPVASGLDRPLYLTAPPGDPRLFVVEQGGRIRIVRDGRLLPVPFLDLSDRVRAGGERGLLGLAFHPRYRETGFLYVDYTDLQGNTKVERYSVSRDSDRADPASARLILAIDQPYANHNGGDVVFGPDGMLYVGMGDGGSGGDPHGNGQNRSSLLGKLLRLDVDRGTPYTVPRDNPFVATAGARGEVWAYGLRNPWRFCFDPPAGLLYIADVGQDRWEEIDVQPASLAGLDYGWNAMEGSHCFRTPGCRSEGRVLPAVEYGHGEGCSVTGGFVYRGRRLPGMVGHYFYADFCSGWIRSFKIERGAVTEHREWQGVHVDQPASFGLDGQGELYVCDLGGGVYRLVPAAPAGGRGR
jgi:glucose/arabinose dehydrogenase